MITEIVLRNWKAHERTSLSFQKGVNVLIGIMGAGKSSVMDAISFGLFGTFPALKQRRIKTEQLLKSRPKKEDSAEIKLSFVSGNDVYTVTRQISASGGATARLEKNGEYLQTQPIRVNEEISSILKIDYDTFARAVYSEQNGLDYFLNITKSERKRQIDDMLGLDQFASAEENCTSLVNSIKSIIDNEKQALDRVDIAALKKELSGKSAEKEAVLESQKKLDGEAGRLREELLALDSKIRNMKKAIEKREGLEREAAEINSKMKLLIAEIEKIKKSGGGAEEGRVKAEKEKLERVLKGKNDEHADLMKKERNASGEVLKLQAEIADTERKIKERNSILNKIKGVDAHGLEREIDEAKSRLEGLMGEKEAISVKIKDAKESAAKLKKHLAVCPVCERELDDDLRALLLKKRENELTRMEADLNEGAGEITILEKALKGLQEKAAELSLSSMRLKDFEGLDEKFEKSNKELEKTGKEADGLASALKSASEEMDRIRKLIEEHNGVLTDLKRLSGYSYELEKAKRELDKINEEIALVEARPSELDKLNAEFSEKNKSLGSVEATVSGNRERVSLLDAAIESTTKQLAYISDVELRISKRRSLVSDLSVFKAAIADTAAQLRTKMIRSINGLFDAVWPDLYPYGDYNRLKLSASQDDYALEVVVSGPEGEETLPVDSIASGGERSIACLALRIAMSMVVVPNLKWLILDEPTHNLDANGISNLIDVLGGTLPKVVDQVFIITHDESLKQIAAAKIYQFERDKAAYGATIVSEL
ncbi:hypothetical protein M1397_02715 [Candidatus Marsarchaeota archaeon]|nr:hypothetical protein [Candidatus Marsarchaeota archaeon]